MSDYESAVDLEPQQCVGWSLESLLLIITYIYSKMLSTQIAWRHTKQTYYYLLLEDVRGMSHNKSAAEFSVSFCM